MVDNNVQVVGATRPPREFDPDVEDREKSWKKWKQQFTWYSVSSGINNQAPEIQVAALMNAMGEKVIDIYNSLDLTEAQEKDAKEIIKKFDEVFKKSDDSNFFRARFFEIQQGSSQNFSDFLVQLKVESSKCNFGDLANDMILLQIQKGITSEKLKDKLIGCKTLEEAKKICREFELVEERRAKTSVNEPLDVIKKSFSKKQDLSYSDKCENCGLIHEDRKCPAFGKTCHKCQKKNHFFRMCRSSNQNSRKFSSRETVSSVANLENEDHLVLRLDSANDQSVEEDWYEEIVVQGQRLRFKLDTGARSNVLPKKFVDKLNVKLEPSKSKFIVSYNNQRNAILGEFTEKCTILSTGSSQILTFIVVDVDSSPILGKKSCVNLNLVRRVNEVKWEDDIYSGLGCLKNFEYKLEFMKDAKFEIRPTRSIPFAKRDEVKAEIEKMVEWGVLVKVEEPTPVVSNLVLVVKKGKLRVCLDPSDINKVIMRRHFKLKTVDEVTSNVSDSKWFTKLDLKKGFWQIKIEEESRKYLTMGTPWGRYSYTRLPFGLASAPELFQDKISSLLSHFQNVEVSMDDVIVHHKTKEELEQLVQKVMNVLYENGLRLNREKCEFSKQSIKFLGINFTENGITPDEEKIAAVKNLEVPQTRKQLRRVLGMVNSLSKFIDSHSLITEPLRKLLPVNVEFLWEKEQDEAFERIKEKLSSLPVLRYYDVALPTVVSVDASENSVGAVLLQNGQPVAYASRALTQSQKNYPQIEKECYAIRFGLQKFHDYIYGKEIAVETDHKPLEFIFKKPLNNAPPRLRTLIFDCLQYNPKVIYKKGADIPIADVLSRDVKNANPTDTDNDVEVHIVLSMTNDWKNKIITGIENSEHLKKLRDVIIVGWPESKTALDQDLRQYWNFRDELSVYEKMIFKSDQILIPPSLKKEVLEIIHVGHTGITGCINRAKQMLFWIGMGSDIENFVKGCEDCQKYQKTNIKEPMVIREVPHYPFQHVYSDVFHFNNKNYLLIVDSYSNWFDFKHIKTLLSSEFIKHFKQWFGVLGTPEKFFSDNAASYTSQEFKKFAEEWSFELHTSSPLYAQSNGLSERFVQESKKILKKCEEKDIEKALAAIRNTPRGELGSANQRAFSRNIRTSLPSTEKVLLPTLQENIPKKIMKAKTIQKKYYDETTKSRKDFSINQKVSVYNPMKKVWIPAEIVAKDAHPRSWIIKSSEGKFRRNSKFIRNSYNQDIAQEAPQRIITPQKGRESVLENLTTVIFRNVQENIEDNHESQSDPEEEDDNTYEDAFEDYENQSVENSSMEDIQEEERYTRTGRMVKKPGWFNMFQRH